MCSTSARICFKQTGYCCRSYEYKVVPAPSRGTRAKGVKGAPGRFSLSLEQVMNMLGAEGWEYQRTDTLPSEERQGLTGTTTTYTAA